MEMLWQRKLAHSNHKWSSRLALLLDSYGVKWLHEPHSFPIAFDEDGEPTGYFTPDFYLPETDEYIELIVLK